MCAWAGYYGWLHAPHKDSHDTFRDIYGDAVWLPGAPCEYIAGWFSDLGWYARGFNGPEPLSWSEIKSWSDLSGTNADAWEFGALRAMSNAYCNWYSKTSQDNKIDPPIIPDDAKLKEIQGINAKRMKAMMRAS